MNARLVAVMAASLLTWGPVAGTASATAFVTLLAAIDPPVALAAAELSVTKDGPPTGTRGVPFKYAITVVNSNATDAATGTEVSDDLPPGLTFNAAGSDPGCTLDVSTGDPNDVRCVVGEAGVLLGADAGLNSDTLEIDVTPTVAGTYENTASVTSVGTDPQDSDPVMTDVAGAADLSIAKTGPATGTAGEAFNYTLTVANSDGSDPAVDTLVTDDLPEGLTYNDTASDTRCGLDGGTPDDNDVTCDLDNVSGDGSGIPITINVTPSAKGTYENTASVASSTADPETTNNSSAASVNVTDAGSGGGDPGAGGTPSSGSTTPTGNAVTPTPAPTGTPPRVVVRSPRLASDTGRTGRFRISVRNRGAASSSSASGYELQIREPGAGASRTRHARISADDLSVVFRGKPGRTYVIRARAINSQGRKGRFGESRTVVPVDDGRFTHRALRYSGRWKEPRNGMAYGGRLSQSSRRGARISYRFRGDRLFLVGRKSRRGGKALVVLNGSRRVVSFYGRRTLNRRVIATLRGKSGQINKVRIVNLGTKGARNGKGTRVELDALGARRLR